MSSELFQKKLTNKPSKSLHKAHTKTCDIIDVVDNIIDGIPDDKKDELYDAIIDILIIGGKGCVSSCCNIFNNITK